MRISDWSSDVCSSDLVNDEAAIALLLLRIGAVVMDAVAVEGQRRIAEQQGLRRADFAMRVPARGIETPFAGRGRRERRIGDGGLAKDDRLRLLLRERPGQIGRAS